MIPTKRNPFAWPAVVVAAVLLISTVQAQTYTLESATITHGADVLADKSIQVVGQSVVGVISNASYTIEVGQVPCLLASFKGDMDADFDIDFVDLDAFVAVLLGIDTDANHVFKADMNGDGTPNGMDIDLFVTVMLTLS